MRKTSLTFLLFIEVASLFLVYNINHLFVSLGNAEIQHIKEQCRHYSALAVLSPDSLIKQLQANPLFSTVRIEKGRSGEETNESLTPPVFILRSQLPAGRVLKLVVPIDSPTLRIIRKIHSVSTGILIIGGLLLLATTVALILQIRKAKPPADRSLPIDPLQSYLLDLKGREIKMLQEVSHHRETVEQKESLTGLILNQVHFAVITLGKGERVRLFNRKAEEIFQKSFASVVNCPLSDVLSDHSELIPFILDPQKRAKTQEIVTHGMTLSCCTSPLPHEGLLVTIEDITALQETRKLESEKKTLLQLGEMANYLSHEVRNSLGVIYGYSKTLKDSDPKIDLINKEIHFLTDMMERFLGFAKPAGTIQQTMVAIDRMLEEICITHGLSIEPTIAGEISVLTDPQLLRNVLDNLVRNAKQAGATHLSCVFKKGKRTAEAIITDNGEGIPEESIDKIWLPFFTTREKGTGMGLALTRKLINAMCGEIDLLGSRAGETRFIIKLPADQP